MEIYYQKLMEISPHCELLPQSLDVSQQNRDEDSLAAGA
jgi:hypothetical protein